MSDSTPHDDDAARLENIVDDVEAKNASADWAVDQIADGKSIDDVVAELVARGWSQSDAEEIGDQARVRTRRMRNVVSQEDVRDVFKARDPNVIRQGASIGRGNLFGFAGSLFGAIVRVWKTRHIGKK